QLTASIPASDIEGAGNAAVTVFNPEPGGGTSNPVNFVITTSNPVPTISSLSPPSALAGGQGFNLTVNGSNFVSGSVVRWNGANRTTTFVSASQIAASIPASDISSAGAATVTVFNPSPGGGTSNSQTFNIVASSLTITDLPDSAESLDQPSFSLAMGAPASRVFSGQVILAFTPVASADDPAIQFSLGGRSVSFSIA